MHVLGIREGKDIDLCVTSDLYNELLNDKRFTHKEMPWGGYNLCIKIDNVDIEIIPKLEWEAFPVTVEMAIGNSFKVDGVNFMSLDHLKGFKKALGREKDFADIKLIEEWERVHGR